MWLVIMMKNGIKFTGLGCFIAMLFIIDIIETVDSVSHQHFATVM